MMILMKSCNSHTLFQCMLVPISVYFNLLFVDIFVCLLSLHFFADIYVIVSVSVVAIVTEEATPKWVF